MRRLIIPTIAFVMFIFHKTSAQQNGTVRLKSSHAKQNPQRIVADSSSTPPPNAMHNMTHSKNASNTSLPLDAATLPPSGAVVPGNRK